MCLWFSLMLCLAHFASGSHKRSHSLGEKEIGRSPPSPAPEQPFRDRSNTLSEKPTLPVIRDKYKDLTGEVEVRSACQKPQHILVPLLPSRFQHNALHCLKAAEHRRFLLCSFEIILCCCRRANATHTSGRGVWKVLWRSVFVCIPCSTSSHGQTLAIVRVTIQM